MIKLGKISILLLVVSMVVYTGCASSTSNIKYKPGAISDVSQIAIFSWRGAGYVSSPVLTNTLANSMMGVTETKYKELTSIASHDFAEQDMFEAIPKELPGTPIIIQPSDYVLNSEGKVDLQATGQKIGADVVLEMTTYETAREISKKNNSFLTDWRAQLRIEAKLWKVTDKEILWQKTCSATSTETFGEKAFKDCSQSAVACLINDLKYPGI